MEIARVCKNCDKPATKGTMCLQCSKAYFQERSRINHAKKVKPPAVCQTCSCGIDRPNLKCDACKNATKIASKTYKAEYYKNNPEKIRAHQKTRAEKVRNDPELYRKVHERLNHAARVYRSKNLEKIRQQRQSRFADPVRYEVQKLMSRNYKANNRDKVNEYTRNYKANNPSFKIGELLRSRLLGVMRIQNAFKRAPTFALLGCSLEFFKTWLSYGFSPEMRPPTR